MWVNTQKACDYRTQAAGVPAQRLRDDGEVTLDAIVEHPETAEKLKPWYGKNCKRVCFHDDYLPAFNLPNVHLVDTPTGTACDSSTPPGAVGDGVEYPLDCLIFVFGLRDQHDDDRSCRLRTRWAADGIARSERWSEGV